jgi:ATP-dependent helicase YprA (DUF1998 family)
MTPHDPSTAAPEGARRRRRGGRGRGARPDTAQRTEQPQTDAPVVPVEDDAMSSAHPTTPATLPTDATFADLGVPAPLVEVLAASRITAPFPIQVATLPDTLAGRDVLGRGRTGSGKTLAFSLPLAARLAASDSRR